MAPSPDDSNQLQPPSRVPRTIQQKPATVPVQAVSGVLGDIGDNAVTGRAEYIRQSTDEEMIWQESPSLALLLPRFIKYAILMAIVLFACSAVKNFVARNPYAQGALESVGIHATAESRPSEPARRAGHKPRSGRRAPDQPADTSSPDATTDAAPEVETPRNDPPGGLGQILAFVKLGFAGLFTLLFLVYLLKLTTTKYCASSQRLIVEEGSWHSEKPALRAAPVGRCGDREAALAAHLRRLESRDHQSAREVSWAAQRRICTRHSAPGRTTRGAAGGQDSL